MVGDLVLDFYIMSQLVRLFSLFLNATHPYDIGNHRSEKHVVQLHVFILEHVLQASSRAVLGNDANVGRLSACSNKCTNVVVAQVFQLRRREEGSGDKNG